MSSSESTVAEGSFTASDVFGVAIDPQTYTNLVYILLAFPLGVAYYMVLTIGFGFGAILSVFLIGIGILIATVACVRLVAGFERWLANTLLGTALERSSDVHSSEGSLWATGKAYLDAPSTWRGLGFVLIKFWIGILAVMLLILLFMAITLITSLLRYPYEAEIVTVNDQPITWTIASLPEAALATVIGLVLGLVFLHLTNAFAYVSRQMAFALLGESESPEPVAEPAESGE